MLRTHTYRCGGRRRRRRVDRHEAEFGDQVLLVLLSMTVRRHVAVRACLCLGVGGCLQQYRAESAHRTFIFFLSFYVLPSSSSASRLSCKTWRRCFLPRSNLYVFNMYPRSIPIKTRSNDKLGPDAPSAAAFAA
jgi:hypothetical protein